MSREETTPAHVDLEGVDELSLEAFRALRDTMKLSGLAMGRRFGAHGAHMGQAAVLRVLGARDGISQREISEMLHLTPPSITAALQAAEKAGLVERKTDEADQRLTRVYLTEQGRVAAAAQRVVLADFINQTLGALSAEERSELARLLGKVKDNIEAANRKEAR
jgi:DNA-binding MarR family transcriptional regulator